ncbi:MAG: hypothetical protein ACYS4W_02720 [Planctomycetota bacterium]|jgi:hypothetical protein
MHSTNRLRITAGQTGKLDLYEGMSNVFLAALGGSPKSKTGLTKVDVFPRQHLDK